MLETVAVVHNELNVGIYRLLSDFFRFCGVSVYNYSVEENTELQWDYKFSAVFLDDTQGQQTLSESQRQHFHEKGESQNFFWLNSENARYNLESGEGGERKDFLSCVISMLSSKGLLQDEDAEVLNQLAKFFVEKDVMKNRIILQTFLNEPRYIRVVREAFVDTYVDLLKYKDKWENNSYFWFAQRYLEQSINESCSFLDENMMLATNKVTDHIKKQIEAYNDYKVHQALLYVSIACFYECDLFEQRRSVENWREAYKLVSGSPFEPVFSYRLGRSVEKRLGDWNEAIEHYTKTLDSLPNEYRAAYKVAVYYWRQKKDISKACEYFRRIDDILDSKCVHNLLQPREAEYLYKAWHFIRQIIRENDNRPVNDIDAQFAEGRMEAILQRVRDDVHTNPIYALIFGKEALIESKDTRQPQVDVRKALADRVRVVCAL